MKKRKGKSKTPTLKRGKLVSKEPVQNLPEPTVPEPKVPATPKTVKVKLTEFNRVVNKYHKIRGEKSEEKAYEFMRGEHLMIFGNDGSDLHPEWMRFRVNYSYYIQAFEEGGVLHALKERAKVNYKAVVDNNPNALHPLTKSLFDCYGITGTGSPVGMSHKETTSVTSNPIPIQEKDKTQEGDSEMKKHVKRSEKKASEKLSTLVEIAAAIIKKSPEISNSSLKAKILEKGHKLPDRFCGFARKIRKNLAKEGDIPGSAVFVRGKKVSKGKKSEKPSEEKSKPKVKISSKKSKSSGGKKSKPKVKISSKKSTPPETAPVADATE